MEVQQARVFMALAEELHFGRAAERLGMGQSLLSRTIRQLEEELGATLFQRTTRNVRLAPAGSALFEPARQMIGLQRVAVDSVKRAAAGEVGQLSFGFARASSRGMAASLVAAAYEDHPGITFAIESNVFADEGLTRLADGSLDLALVRWTRQPPTITGRPVLIERPVVTLPDSHRLARRKLIRVDELADEDLLSLPANPNSTLRETTIRLCYNAGFSPRVILELPDAQTISALIAAGMGITITFDSVAATMREPGTVTVPLDVTDESSVVYLAHLRTHGSASLSAVLAIAETVLPTVGSTSE
ncbi:LysR family transcriptional regulator [Brevibacterium sp. UCMA 11752]|uniref:LysR family transcriptional regulator n=1 Tax=Brevibacterium sp. UCMA 11752 TaxID=2745946 RepID=UPI001F1B1F8D|nr:LysR substrate-binding domain-containing protein [Brevibacterium sp. UCMA 11752]